MITWLTWKLYEVMFGVQVSGGSLDFVRFLGFVELLLEILLAAILVVVDVISIFESKKNSNG